MSDLWAILMQDALLSALATAGFAMVFNVPRRALPYCVLVGMTGHTLRTLVMTGLGASIVLGTLAGATAVGLMAYALARYLKMPSLIFGITGGIPMVPGVFAFQTMMALLQIVGLPPVEAEAMLLSAAVNGITTGLILGALAAGIVLPAMVLNREKPVV